MRKLLGLTLAVGLALAACGGGDASSNRQKIERIYDCLMEAETEAEEEACTPHLDPRDQDSDGDVDGEDLETCLFWATTDQQRADCEADQAAP